jgi:hypothetical protein
VWIVNSGLKISLVDCMCELGEVENAASLLQSQFRLARYAISTRSAENRTCISVVRVIVSKGYCFQGILFPSKFVIYFYEGMAKDE